MNANVAEPWERMGWRFIGVVATLIVLMSFWATLENAIHSVAALGKR
jgi:hypothetical protein